MVSLISLISPQDDDPDFDPLNCECEFTPYDDSEEDSWHYLRRCSNCQATWYSLHCRCEQPNRLCGNCHIKRRL